MLHYTRSSCDHANKIIKNQIQTELKSNSTSFSESAFNPTPSSNGDNEGPPLSFNNLRLLPPPPQAQQQQQLVLGDGSSSSSGKLLLKKRRQTEPLSLPSVSGAAKMHDEGK